MTTFLVSSARRFPSLSKYTKIQSSIYETIQSVKFSTDESKEGKNKKNKKQDFVKVDFEPGEWDQNMKDPLANPPWKSKYRILSADEMNHRPVVFLKDRPPSLRESGFLPTWLFERQREGIYNMYLDMMNELSTTGSGTTSHEYVCYVIAQKFNLNKERVAAVIQLRHKEEQLKKEGHEMYDDCQRIMDEAMQKLMITAYSAMGYRHPPDSYIEDPSPHPKESTREIMAVDDLFDEEQAEEDAIKRDQEKAKFILNNKRFIEDIHPAKRTVKLDGNARSFIKQRDALKNKEFNTFSKNKKKAKFLCKFIDTAQEKKIQKKNKKVRSQIHNIVVEDNHSGQVRAATMEEIYSSSFKPNRYPLEFMYRDAKKGWLDKTMLGKDTWGKAPVDETAQSNA